MIGQSASPTEQVYAFECMRKAENFKKYCRFYLFMVCFWKLCW